MAPEPICYRMDIFLFWSEADIEVFALTLDREGENLPAEYGPWSKNGHGEALEVGAGESIAVPRVSNAIVRAVQRDGFYLAEIGRSRRVSLSDQTYVVSKRLDASENREAAPCRRGSAKRTT
jgi:hypothetical protein